MTWVRIWREDVTRIQGTRTADHHLQAYTCASTIVHTLDTFIVFSIAVEMGPHIYAGMFVTLPCARTTCT
jgi:hypothetical protein